MAIMKMKVKKKAVLELDEIAPSFLRIVEFLHEGLASSFASVALKQKETRERVREAREKIESGARAPGTPFHL
jgi:hypothetical protein